MAYPIDNPFRPPVEFISSIAATGSIVGIAFYQQFFGLDLATSFAISAPLLALAVWRGRQGYKILLFHTKLRWLPKYELKSEEIPVSTKELFLGMGFWWGEKHSQRLFTARLPKYEHLRARNKRYEWARQFERDHPGHWLNRFLGYEHPINPVSPLPPVGGDPAIHGVEPDEREIWTSLAERVGHLLVLGTTRVGKTRLAELLVTQDIRRGEVVIVFDPKGDVALLKRMYAEASRCGREKDFWFFHLGYPELSDRYSPISSIGRITEVATRIANQLPGEGQSQAFKEFVWLFINVISRAISALGMNPTYTLIYQYAVDVDALGERYFEYWLNKVHPEWIDEIENISSKEIEAMQKKTGRSLKTVEFIALLREKDWHDPVADGLVSILSNDKTRFQMLINSLYPLLEKLTTGKVSELLSPTWDNPTEKRRVFDWDKIMNTGGIVYVGLDSLSDAEVAAAVGNAMFADLTSTAGRRYKFGTAFGQSQGLDVKDSKKVAIHADEFNELIGDEFVPLLNKAGGAGYQVTVYTQTWSDVEAKIGNRAKAAQIGGNLNSLIMLRVKTTDTAEILTEQLPEVEVSKIASDSRTTDVQNPDDFADFGSSSGDVVRSYKVPMLRPSDLTSLPKGQAFALLDGGQLAKVRLPLAVESVDDIHWPESLFKVFDGMHEQYSRYVKSLDDEQVTPLPIDFSGNTSDGLTVEGKGHGF